MKIKDEMVDATAHETNTEEQQTWADILTEKLSTNEISVFRQSVIDEFPELNPASELSSLLAIKEKYVLIESELNREKNQCSREKDCLGTLVSVYPEIIDRCPEIEPKLKQRLDDLNFRTQIFNYEYFQILRAQQEKLKEELEENLNSIKLLNRNNKQTRADEATNPDLKEEKNQKKKSLLLTNKEIRKRIKGNDLELPVLTIAEIIESKCSLVFTKTNYGRFTMEYNDDMVAININHKVNLLKNGTGYTYSEVLDDFDIDIFLQKLPAKYWLAKQRDQQIDSILN